MKKKRITWLKELLTAEELKLAEANGIGNPNEICDKEQAIGFGHPDGFFNWNKSKEGFGYWSKIADERFLYENIEEQPKESQLSIATRTVKEQAEKIGELEFDITMLKQEKEEWIKISDSKTSKIQELKQKLISAEIDKKELKERLKLKVDEQNQKLSEINGEYFIRIKALEKAIIKSFIKSNV